MLQDFFAWRARHPGRYWTGATAVSIALITIQFLDLGSPRAFWLLPYPSTDVRAWVAIVEGIFRAAPWLAAGVFVVPLVAVALALAGRRWQATTRARGA